MWPMKHQIKVSNIILKINLGYMNELYIYTYISKFIYNLYNNGYLIKWIFKWANCRISSCHHICGSQTSLGIYVYVYVYKWINYLPKHVYEHTHGCHFHNSRLLNHLVRPFFFLHQWFTSPTTCRWWPPVESNKVYQWGGKLTFL